MLIAKMYLENLLSVDKLHYKEIKIINDLYDLVKKNNKKKIDKKLDELVKDVEHHFETEERKMFEYNFPWVYKHQFVHECALQTLYEKRDEWKETKDKKIIKTYLEKQLLPWFNAHVMTLDRVACDFLVTHWSN